MSRAAANRSAGLAFPLSSNSELLGAYSLIIFLWSPSAVWTLLIAKCSVSQSHSVFSLLSATFSCDSIKSRKKRMDPVSVLAAAAALNCELLQHYQSRSATEMTLLSPHLTFSALQLNNKKGLLFKCARCTPLFPLLHLCLVFDSFLQQLLDYKQIQHGNWKNDWTFSLAEDRGVSVGGRTLCVFGGVKSRWREEGGGFRVGGVGGVMVV